MNDESRGKNPANRLGMCGTMKRFLQIFPLGAALLLAGCAGISQGNDKYEAIEGTTSPNGRYAIALGTNANPNPDLDDKSIRNYVVDLKTSRILGITGGRYFGTATHYNDDSCDVSWSPDSSIFVQVIHWKWYSYCRAGRIVAGKLAGAVDLQTAAENFAYQFLAEHKDKAYLKHHRDFGVTVDSPQYGGGAEDRVKIGNDGVIELMLDGGMGNSVEEDSSFEVIERLKLTGRMGVELIDIRYAP